MAFTDLSDLTDLGSVSTSNMFSRLGLGDSSITSGATPAVTALAGRNISVSAAGGNNSSTTAHAQQPRRSSSFSASSSSPIRLMGEEGGQARKQNLTARSFGGGGRAADGSAALTAAGAGSSAIGGFGDTFGGVSVFGNSNFLFGTSSTSLGITPEVNAQLPMPPPARRASRTMPFHRAASTGALRTSLTSGSSSFTSNSQNLSSASPTSPMPAPVGVGGANSAFGTFVAFSSPAKGAGGGSTPAIVLTTPPSAGGHQKQRPNPLISAANGSGGGGGAYGDSQSPSMFLDSLDLDLALEAEVDGFGVDELEELMAALDGSVSGGGGTSSSSPLLAGGGAPSTGLSMCLTPSGSKGANLSLMGTMWGEPSSPLTADRRGPMISAIDGLTPRETSLLMQRRATIQRRLSALQQLGAGGASPAALHQSKGPMVLPQRRTTNGAASSSSTSYSAAAVAPTTAITASTSDANTGLLASASTVSSSTPTATQQQPQPQPVEPPSPPQPTAMQLIWRKLQEQKERDAAAKKKAEEEAAAAASAAKAAKAEAPASGAAVESAEGMPKTAAHPPAVTFVIKKRDGTEEVIASPPPQQSEGVGPTGQASGAAGTAVSASTATTNASAAPVAPKGPTTNGSNSNTNVPTTNNKVVEMRTITTTIVTNGVPITRTMQVPVGPKPRVTTKTYAVSTKPPVARPVFKRAQPKPLAAVGGEVPPRSPQQRRLPPPSPASPSALAGNKADPSAQLGEALGIGAGWVDDLHEFMSAIGGGGGNSEKGGAAQQLQGLKAKTAATATTAGAAAPKAAAVADEDDDDLSDFDVSVSIGTPTPAAAFLAPPPQLRDLAAANQEKAGEETPRAPAQQLVAKGPPQQQQQQQGRKGGAMEAPLALHLMGTGPSANRGASKNDGVSPPARPLPNFPQMYTDKGETPPHRQLQFQQFQKKQHPPPPTAAAHGGRRLSGGGGSSLDSDSVSTADSSAVSGVTAGARGPASPLASNTAKGAAQPVVSSRAAKPPTAAPQSTKLSQATDTGAPPNRPPSGKRDASNKAAGPQGANHASAPATLSPSEMPSSSSAAASPGVRCPTPPCQKRRPTDGPSATASTNVPKAASGAPTNAAKELNAAVGHTGAEARKNMYTSPRSLGEPAATPSSSRQEPTKKESAGEGDSASAERALFAAGAASAAAIDSCAVTTTHEQPKTAAPIAPLPPAVVAAPVVRTASRSINGESSGADTPLSPPGATAVLMRKETLGPNQMRGGSVDLGPADEDASTDSKKDPPPPTGAEATDPKTAASVPVSPATTPISDDTVQVLQRAFAERYPNMPVPLSLVRWFVEANRRRQEEEEALFHGEEEGDGEGEYEYYEYEEVEEGEGEEDEEDVEDVEDVVESDAAALVSIASPSSRRQSSKARMSRMSSTRSVRSDGTCAPHAAMGSFARPRLLRSSSSNLTNKQQQQKGAAEGIINPFFETYQKFSAATKSAEENAKKLSSAVQRRRASTTAGLSSNNDGEGDSHFVNDGVASPIQWMRSEGEATTTTSGTRTPHSAAGSGSNISSPTGTAPNRSRAPSTNGGGSFVVPHIGIGVTSPLMAAHHQRAAAMASSSGRQSVHTSPPIGRTSRLGSFNTNNGSMKGASSPLAPDYFGGGGGGSRRGSTFSSDGNGGGGDALTAAGSSRTPSSAGTMGVGDLQLEAHPQSRFAHLFDGTTAAVAATGDCPSPLAPTLLTAAGGIGGGNANGQLLSSENVNDNASPPAKGRRMRRKPSVVFLDTTMSDRPHYPANEAATAERGAHDGVKVSLLSPRSAARTENTQPSFAADKTNNSSNNKAAEAREGVSHTNGHERETPSVKPLSAAAISQMAGAEATLRPTASGEPGVFLMSMGAHANKNDVVSAPARRSLTTDGAALPSVSAAVGPHRLSQTYDWEDVRRDLAADREALATPIHDATYFETAEEEEGEGNAPTKHNNTNTNGEADSSIRAAVGSAADAFAPSTSSGTGTDTPINNSGDGRNRQRTRDSLTDAFPTPAPASLESPNPLRGAHPSAEARRRAPHPPSSDLLTTLSPARPRPSPSPAPPSDGRPSPHNQRNNILLSVPTTTFNGPTTAAGSLSPAAPASLSPPHSHMQDEGYEERGGVFGDGEALDARYNAANPSLITTYTSRPASGAAEAAAKPTAAQTHNARSKGIGEEEEEEGLVLFQGLRMTTAERAQRVEAARQRNDYFKQLALEYLATTGGDSKGLDKMF